MKMYNSTELLIEGSTKNAVFFMKLFNIYHLQWGHGKNIRIWLTGANNLSSVMTGTGWRGVTLADSSADQPKTDTKIWDSFFTLIDWLSIHLFRPTQTFTCSYLKMFDVFIFLSSLEQCSNLFSITLWSKLVSQSDWSRLLLCYYVNLYRFYTYIFLRNKGKNPEEVFGAV